MKEKVLVLFGGESVEHDISIITALQIMKFLPHKFEFLPVYIDKRGVWWKADNLDSIDTYKNFDNNAKNKTRITFLMGENVLLEQKKGGFQPFVKVVAILNCCHGRTGEDGSVQGLCKVCKIPHTSPAMTESALCMDKVLLKDVLEYNGINTPQYCHFDIQTYDQVTAIKQIKKEIGFPVIIKPANLGSSIGISVCQEESQLAEAVEVAFTFDKKIVVEKLVENLREFNCAAFYCKGQIFTSNVNMVENRSRFFTFEDKYLDKATKNHEIGQKLTQRIKKLTAKTYQLLNLRGIVRIDFLFDAKKRELYVNEINTIPGSLAFYLFKDIKFENVLSSVIEQGLVDFEEDKKLIKTFDSEALNVFNQVKNSCKK